MSNHLQTEFEVSVILLSYNQSKFITQAIEAFERQIFTNFELIVIDDCSTDNSLELLNEWSLKTKLSHKILNSETNQGICRNINRALSVSSGRYISIIAADDWPNEDFLFKLHKLISSSEDRVAFVFSDVNKVSIGGEQIPEVPPNASTEIIHFSSNQMFESLLISNVVNAPSAMIKKSSLNKVGNYDESLVFEDYDMWLRLSFVFSSIKVEEKLVNYRINPSSISRKPEWFEKRKLSEISLLEKWYGLSAEYDSIISNHIRSICLELLKQGMYKSTSTILKNCEKFSPSFKWKIFRLFTSSRPMRWITFSGFNLLNIG